MQLMFARLKMSWQDACFLSFHGEPPCGVEEMIMSGKTVVLLTGKIYTPQKIAKYFIDKGVPNNIKAAVGADLSYPNERLYKGTIEDLSNLQENYLNSVVVIYHE
jgi:cobalt-precorrin-7 (C5)-methyltransferase